MTERKLSCHRGNYLRDNHQLFKTTVWWNIPSHTRWLQLLQHIWDNCSDDNLYSFPSTFTVFLIIANVRAWLNNMIYKTNKAELINALLALSPCIIKTYLADTYHVIDGFAWFYRILWSKVGKLSELYWLFLDSLPFHQGRATVIFDDYTQENTKAPQQKRQKSNTLSTHIDVKMNTIIPKDRKKLLSCK